MDIAGELGIKPQNWSPQQYHDKLLAPLGVVINAMERTGVCVDADRLRAIDSDMSSASERLRKELDHWTGGRDINWNSWQQLSAWMHNSPDDAEPGLGIEPSPYCKKGEVPDDKVSTDDRALEWLAGHNPEHRAGIQTLRSLRTHERMGRYARSWLEVAVPHPDGTLRLHPSFGLASDADTRPGARTGRFGVKNPALNQVPRNTSAAGELGLPKDPAGMRSAFIAPPGKRLVVVDYSQLEIVILAHLIAALFGHDNPLVQAVASGQDIHGPLAHKAFGELAGDETVMAAALSDFKIVPLLKLLRDLAKAIIYGNNYGKGEYGFATSVFLPDGTVLGPARAKLLVDALHALYHDIRKYQRYVADWVGKHANISSLFGRWYPLPNAKSFNKGLRNRAYRQGLNYGMQAGGQEIMVLALLAIYSDAQLRDCGYVPALPVHDELLGWADEDRADEALARKQQIMRDVVSLLVPLRTEGGVGINWKLCK